MNRFSSIEGRKRADLLEPIGRRHHDVAFRAQPSPIIETVLGDECARRTRPNPLASEDLSQSKFWCRDDAAANSVRDAAVRALGNADAADMSAAPRPGRTAVGAQPLVVRLGVERDDAGATQVGQLGWHLPIHLPALAPSYGDSGSPWGTGGSRVKSRRSDHQIRHLAWSSAVPAARRDLRHTSLAPLSSATSGWALTTPEWVLRCASAWVARSIKPTQNVAGAVSLFISLLRKAIRPLERDR